MVVHFLIARTVFQDGGGSSHFAPSSDNNKRGGLREWAGGAVWAPFTHSSTTSIGIRGHLEISIQVASLTFSGNLGCCCCCCCCCNSSIGSR